MMTHSKSYRIAVVLVNYFGLNDTLACIQSIRAYSDAPCFVLVVDNSQPNQVELSRLKKEDPDLDVLFLNENLGFGSANNRGIDWLKSNVNFDYLWLLNNDTLIAHNTIPEILAPFKNNPKIGLSTCKIVYADRPEIVWYGGGSIDYRRGWPVVTEINQKATKDGADQSRIVTFVSGCSILFSKEALAELKGFDETFFMYVEDLELSIRAEHAGILIWYTAETTIFHKVQGSFVNETNHRGLHPKNNNVAYQFYHKKRNQWFAFRTHLKGKKWVVFSLHYWYHFHIKLIELLVFSHKRFEVLRASLRVLQSILLKK